MFAFKTSEPQPCSNSTHNCGMQAWWRTATSRKKPPRGRSSKQDRSYKRCEDFAARLWTSSGVFKSVFWKVIQHDAIQTNQQPLYLLILGRPTGARDQNDLRSKFFPSQRLTSRWWVANKAPEWTSRTLSFPGALLLLHVKSTSCFEIPSVCSNFHGISSTLLSPSSLVSEYGQKCLKKSPKR